MGEADAETARVFGGTVTDMVRDLLLVALLLSVTVRTAKWVPADE